MSTDQFSVAGTRALVTGASNGIGRAIAERFADDGADVVVCSREQDHVVPIADGINDRAGGRAFAVECDVRDRTAVEGLLDVTAKEVGGLDVLVNNAGNSNVRSFADIDPEEWTAIVDGNLTSTYHCTQVAGPHLKRDGGGAIVNLASVAAFEGAPYMSHYGAAKAGVVNLTRTLAAEWANDGVRINCIAPGTVATPSVTEQIGVDPDAIDRTEIDRRVGTSEEIADVAQFLASPAASYLVGETITASGVPDTPETAER